MHLNYYFHVVVLNSLKKICGFIRAFDYIVAMLHPITRMLYFSVSDKACIVSPLFFRASKWLQHR
jgi:hypothetical protein